MAGLLRSLRLEDGLLAGWLGVVQPLAAASGVGSGAMSPAIGALMVLAVIGAIVCLSTRPPDQPRVVVVAPRVLADPEPGGWRWVVRFVSSSQHR